MVVKSTKKGVLLPRDASYEVIERQFIQGLIQPSGEVYYPTLSELSDVHNIPHSTLHRKLNEGQWINKREVWQASLHKWVSAANMNNYIEAAAKFDETCITAAQRAMTHILMHLDAAASEGKPLDQVSLDRLGRAAVNWQKTGRLALGLSTENNSNRNNDEQSKNNIIDTTLLSDKEMGILDMFVTLVEERKEKN